MYTREEITNKVKEFGVVRCINDYTDKAKKNKYYTIDIISWLGGLKEITIVSITLNDDILTFIRCDSFHLHFEFKSRTDRIEKLLDVL